MVGGLAVKAHAVQKALKRKKGIKNIILVASGKGGVGKSTVAVNLAIAMQSLGAKVGLLDADVYGPSVPGLLSINVRPELNDKRFVPVNVQGLQVMSMGLLVEAQTALMWRGPMVVKAIHQLLDDADWGDLDYLFIDMPPGTGDVQLVAAQNIPVAGAVIVSTPNKVAMDDALRSICMFQKLDVHVLGVLENMAIEPCAQCGHVSAEPDMSRVEPWAESHGWPFLGGIPMAYSIWASTDRGVPIMHSDPDGSIGQSFRRMAQRVHESLAQRPLDYTSLFGSIRLE